MSCVLAVVVVFSSCIFGTCIFITIIGFALFTIIMSTFLNDCNYYILSYMQNNFILTAHSFKVCKNPLHLDEFPRITFLYSFGGWGIFIPYSQQVITYNIKQFYGLNLNLEFIKVYYSICSLSQGESRVNYQIDILLP